MILLVVHLRRWKRSGQRFVVEWNGNPVKAIERHSRTLSPTPVLDPM
jgi:hypothetical protein